MTAYVVVLLAAARVASCGNPELIERRISAGSKHEETARDSASGGALRERTEGKTVKKRKTKRMKCWWSSAVIIFSCSYNLVARTYLEPPQIA